MDLLIYVVFYTVESSFSPKIPNLLTSGLSCRPRVQLSSLFYFRKIFFYSPKEFGPLN